MPKRAGRGWFRKCSFPSLRGCVSDPNSYSDSGWPRRSAGAKRAEQTRPQPLLLAKDIFLNRDITVRHLRTATNVMLQCVKAFGPGRLGPTSLSWTIFYENA